jgi:recombination protein RecR
MSRYWENLVAAIRKFPGVGPKMAERLALFFLKSDETLGILRAIEEAKKNLKRCLQCGMFSETSTCGRCTDSMREEKLLCVLEEVGDLEAMERSGIFRGHYHLLGGALSPLDGVGPRELRIDSLFKRLTEKDSRVEEIILATNPTVEGEATALYLSQLIAPLGKKITRLAYGLASGVSIEYADELTLSRAFEGRTTL